MLRSACRRLPSRSLIRSSRVSVIHRPGLPICRQYADKKPPLDNGKPPPVSDYIATQTPPSNPEIPPDRMPHQAEEDIATEKIFGDETPTETEDGLPAEGAPVEDVFNDNPDAMEKAPKAVKKDSSVNTTEETGYIGGNQDVKGHSGLSQVTEESIAYEGIISGGDASGTEKSAPGDETPAEAVPIEEVGNREKSAVMDESFKDDNEPPSTGQAVRRDNQTTSTTTTAAEESSDPSDSIQTTRKSILDLFGPEKTPKERKPRASQQVSQPIVNPLSSHQLDTSNTDLSDWEKARGLGEYRSEHENDPEKWADMKRGEWESKVDDARSRQRKHESERAEFRKEIVNTFINMPPPEPRGVQNIDLSQLSISEPPPPSQWDYFYPAQPPPKSLSAAIRDDHERRNPSSIRRYEQQKNYNPFKRQKKPIRWPFMYNRDELVELCTNHLMRDGKKATAEKILQTMFLRILEHYPRRHPVTVLAEALDRNAPILKNMNDRTTALKLQITPVPLFEKQRIRIGWKSLIKAAGAKSKGRRCY